MGNRKIRPMRARIAFTVIAIVFISLICIGAVALINTENISKTLINTNKQMSQISRSVSSSSMDELTRVRLQELAEDKADLADRTFDEFKQAVGTVAAAVERLYEEQDNCAEREVPLPDASKNGQISVQRLYATGVDPEDPKVKKESLLLGNIQELLYAVNLRNANIASVYYASDVGVMIQADLIAGMKFDEAGNIMPLDAKTRPWYKGAEETGKVYLTPVTKDLHTPNLAIMCGVPVYYEGRFMGVAGAGMYLNSISELVESVDLGDKGNICIVNNEGRILFSNLKEGSLSVEESSTDLRQSTDENMRDLVTQALSGEHGINELNIDGAPCYVSFAPMKSVGWSVFIVQSTEEVEAPTVGLQKQLDQIAADSEAEAAARSNKAIFFFVIVFITALFAAIIISTILSNRMVKPIQKLTEEVSRIKGDDLDFKWEANTEDETALLAEAFSSLTGRMKTYVNDIQKITAEKERIGTELELATKIQTGMLPSCFPAFPDRKDFDIFASMTPAKEVGGDFYDFFMLDDDHLAMVIADVSGKGVPAALFMMGSMILIRNEVKNRLSPATVLQNINDQICAGNQEDMFVTVWLGILDLKTGRITAANAGHEYPALKQPDGEFELIKDPHGFVIGGLPGEEYTEYEWQLKPGAKIFVYTDGVPEAGEKRTELFGTDRMMEAIRKAEDESPEQILKAVDKAVKDFVGDAPQFDDLTMLCVEYKGQD